MNVDYANMSDAELEIAAFHQPAIDRARKMIFWSGAGYALIPLLFFGMLSSATGTNFVTNWLFLASFGAGLAIWGAHIALSRWAKTSPLPATAIALAVFLAVNTAAFVLGAGINPIMFAVWLFVLGRGTLAGYRAHQLRRTLSPVFSPLA